MNKRETIRSTSYAFAWSCLALRQLNRDYITIALSITVFACRGIAGAFLKIIDRLFDKMWKQAGGGGSGEPLLIVTGQSVTVKDVKRQNELCCCRSMKGMIKKRMWKWRTTEMADCCKLIIILCLIGIEIGRVMVCVGAEPLHRLFCPSAPEFWSLVNPSFSHMALIYQTQHFLLCLLFLISLFTQSSPPPFLIWRISVDKLISWTLCLPSSNNHIFFWLS